MHSWILSLRFAAVFIAYTKLSHVVDVEGIGWVDGIPPVVIAALNASYGVKTVPRN